MDYYFGDQLRWTYGFDNPNKAAALIASILPLLWLPLAGSCAIRRAWARWSSMAAAGALFCAGWWLLLMTYSRGGIVAAAAGCLFAAMEPIFARRRLPGQMTRALGLMATAAAVIAMLFLSTRAAERSVSWVGTHEGSVENRLALWQGGLRMIAENPLGVGAGKSGATYMQWYEPLDLEAGYRTMVNSYLTFLTERGLPLFALVLFAAGVLWGFTSGTTATPLRSGVLRGSLAAFGVAGFFSTTMENLWLWIVPVFSLSVLLFLRMRRTALAMRLPPRPGAAPAPSPGIMARLMETMRLPKIAWTSAAAAVSVSAGLFGTGWLLDLHQPLRVRLNPGPDCEAQVTLRGDADAPELAVYPDLTVLGDDYGKLLRRLALQGHRNLRILQRGASNAGGATMLAGEAAARVPVAKGSALILLAPVRMNEMAAKALLRNAGSVELILPSYDEDGRVAFWQDMAAGSAGPQIRQMSLEGVGLEVDWTWDSVIEACIRQPETRAGNGVGHLSLTKALRSVKHFN